jgi:hypothetical protein
LSRLAPTKALSGGGCYRALAMVVSEDERRGRGLGPCLACAAAFHAALFALSFLRPARAAVNPEAAPPDATAVNVDAETVISDPPATPPGGGSPAASDSTIAAARSPAPPTARRPRTATARPVPAVEPPRADRDSSSLPDSPIDPAPSDEDPPSSLAAMQAAGDRRERDAAAAAAQAAAGGGRGGSGGPGGPGVGWGPVPIHGSNPFGNGSHGALTGRVCFVPVDTLRIADVRDCQYFATLYTDTLDIPERQSFEGFPGVTDRSDWFLIDYTGVFSVAGYGTYVFRLHSDDGSYLYIDDALIIDNDGKHAPESRSGSVQLAVGEHRILVRYAQTTDRMALQLFVRAPGAAETLFTPQF